MQSRQPIAADKKIKTQDKALKVQNAFENMLDDALENKLPEEKEGGVEDDNYSVDDLSDDSSESSDHDSDPLEAFGLGDRDGDNIVKRKRKKKGGSEWKEVLDYLKSVRRRVGKSFIDYGPPYTKKNPGGHLGDECADYHISLFMIHGLLNNRANPNIPDSTELYMTPMHWCARFCHYTAMRMLRRAGADVNPVNELGQSPLGMTCMFNQPPTKASAQIKIVKWLISQGENVCS